MHHTITVWLPFAESVLDEIDEAGKNQVRPLSTKHREFQFKYQATRHTPSETFPEAVKKILRDLGSGDLETKVHDVWEYRTVRNTA